MDHHGDMNWALEGQEAFGDRTRSFFFGVLSASPLGLFATASQKIKLSHFEGSEPGTLIYAIGPEFVGTEDDTGYIPSNMGNPGYRPEFVIQKHGYIPIQGVPVQKFRRRDYTVSRFRNCRVSGWWWGGADVPTACAQPAQ